LNRPERILVTGAAGFTGSSLTDRLLREGRRVLGLDCFDPFYAEVHKRHNLRTARAVPRSWGNICAARDALGYAPAVAFEEGVRRFAAWLREEA
jgi:nucleoside-diphosphate-sugar epimerase